MSKFFINRTIFNGTPILLPEREVQINCLSCSHSWSEKVPREADSHDIQCSSCKSIETVKFVWIDSLLSTPVKDGNNPYFEIFSLIGDEWSSFSYRELLVKEYSYAIPDEKALEIISKYGPVVEFGSGTGYWAKLLSDRGVDILAFDKSPPKENRYNFKRKFFDIKYSDIDALDNIKDRSLMLSWPCYASSFAYDALKRFQGDCLIYIGESMGGCTGNDSFFELLEEEWELVEEHDIPQWFGIHDYLSVFKRK